ncbi:hypothetical protein V6N12_045155 [Hibiscus sabdariffa]|uniref:DUF4283 domain-containing protein n=1 Tax=Hibiscus sabdariffa TaxID=183260 RepID=A0ABR2G259_9ROSI
MFLFKFEKISVAIIVLGRCPWSFNGDLLPRKPFDKMLSPSDYDFTSLPIWIRIFNVLLGLMTAKFGEWLRVDFRKPKHAGVWHPKQGIVLTKRDVDDREASSNVVCESGTLVPHPSQAMVVGGDHGKSACVEDTKTKNTKRTYVRKDNDGSFVTKKAHSEIVTLLDQEAFNRFVTLLWNIWNRHNRWVHDGKLTPVRIVIEHVSTLLTDFAAVRSTSAYHPSHTRSLIWTVPLKALSKLMLMQLSVWTLV